MRKTTVGAAALSAAALTLGLVGPANADRYGVDDGEDTFHGSDILSLSLQHGTENVAVTTHHLGLRRDIGDARPHHARTEHAEAFHIGGRLLRGAPRALAKLLHRLEQGADHVAAGRVHQHAREISRFDLQSGVYVDE